MVQTENFSKQGKKKVGWIQMTDSGSNEEEQRSVNQVQQPKKENNVRKKAKASTLLVRTTTELC